MHTAQTPNFWGCSIMTWKILRFVLMSGNGNSILRSILPGRSRAGSKLSMRLVAKITFTSARESNPSNWFNNSSMVLWISRSPPECASYLPNSTGTSETHSTTHPSSLNYQKCTCGGRTGSFYPMLRKRKTYLFVPTASISSIKTMDGESSSATRKSSRTNLGPSPKYFCISSLPTTRKNVADVEFATACSKLQPQVLLLDCTWCIGGNNNWKQQNSWILSSLSCTPKAHLCKQCLSSPRLPIKDNTLWRLDTNVLIKLWMCER